MQNHCYRADEMLIMIDVAKRVRLQDPAFHHAVEAYKIADVLAANGICAAMWADWWGFKMEAFDGIRENIALSRRPAPARHPLRLGRGHPAAQPGGRQGDGRGQPHGHEPPARRTPSAGSRSTRRRRSGIDDQTGSLEAGKMADVVVWSGNPFSVYSRAEKVYIDGALVYDRNDPARQPRTDFELGICRAAGRWCR